jgi:hypothetical protein
VVLLLLSNEYPMVTTLCDEQVAALAERVKGDETSVLFTGLFTVTPASAGTVRAKTKEEARVKERSMFIRVPLRFKARLKASFGAGYDSPFVSRKEAENVFLNRPGWSEGVTNAPD